MLTKERVIQIVNYLPDLDVFVHSDLVGILVMRDSLDWILDGHDSFEIRVNNNGINIHFN